MVKAVMEQQGKDNVLMNALKKQLADVESGIENILNAIQMGIVNASTKKRMDELEERRNELLIDIGREELACPTLTEDQIYAFIVNFRKLNMGNLEHKRRLIYTFVNRIYLYDDRYIITFNYSPDTDEVPLSEVEGLGLLSELTCYGEPNKKDTRLRVFFISVWVRVGLVSDS